MKIFQMKKNESNMDSDIKKKTAQNNNLSLINEEEKKEGNDSIINVNKNPNIETIENLNDNNKNISESEGSESSQDSQNTLKFNFNGAEQGKELAKLALLVDKTFKNKILSEQEIYAIVDQYESHRY